MKGKVFGLVVIVAVVTGIMSYMGYLGKGDQVQIRGRYVKNNCGDDNIDMKVIAVSDSSLIQLIGKTVSPEIAFKQSNLNNFINDRLGVKGENEDFYLVGSLKEGPVLHCSGSLCFKVKMIKQGNEKTFTEF